MTTELPPVDEHQELRDAIRALCAGFDTSYWQNIDEQRAYPQAFVEALTGAGWLAGRPTGPRGPRHADGLEDLAGSMEAAPHDTCRQGR